MKDWKILARARMKELNITQLELAKELSHTQSAISQWFSGKRRVDIDLVNKIFSALKLPPIPVDSVTSLERVYEYPLISWESLSLFSKDWKPENTGSFIKTEINAGPNGYWLKIQNDSMMANSGFSFSEGMYILVNPCALVSNDCFVIAKNTDNNQVTFKKYIEDAGIAYLKPLNSAYQTTEQNCSWQIIGKVIDARWKLE